MRRGSVRAWCTGSTRIRPAACSSPRRALPPQRSQKLSLARGPQDLLGAGRRRAPAAAGPHLHLPCQGGAGGRFGHAYRPAWRGGREPRHHLLRRGRDRGGQARLAVVEAGHRPHASIACAYGAYRSPDRRRPEIFFQGELGMPGGLQNRLHLLARRIVVPHPRGGIIDMTAPLPPHMQQSWNLLGFDATRYDPIVDAPEE